MKKKSISNKLVYGSRSMTQCVRLNFKNKLLKFETDTKLLFSNYFVVFFLMDSKRGLRETESMFFLCMLLDNIYTIRVTIFDD